MSDQRYRVIDRLEAGGMAEVFVGEAVSVQGFKKKCAIKRVLPHLAQNRNFIAMFLDEARLGARLNHANIVSVLDIGAADNTYFLVMEFVDGANLKNVMETLRRQGQHFPMKEAIFIAKEACQGLSYAHEATDDDGQSLHIVHRDVSPPNIMISKRGEVKLTDFGLARATTQLEKTDPGVVKGKFSYLSPEAARGEAIDHRADVFALGIVLWEMLAGRRLFLGETDYQTVKLVQQANVPSLQRLNPEVDAEFEQLLARALAPIPADRYQNARELSDALMGYLFSHQMKVSSYEMAAMIKNVLAAKGAGQRPREQSIIDRLIQEELLRFTSLDDMTDPLSPGSLPLSPEEVAGAAPLDAMSFENPQDWFSDDADVGDAIEQHAGKKKDEPPPKWHEAGLGDVEEGNLAQSLEGNTGLNVVDQDRLRSILSGPPPKTSPPPEAPEAPAPVRRSEPPRAAAPLGAPRSTPSEPPRAPEVRRSNPPPANPKSIWTFVVVMLLVLAAVGTAAWLGILRK